MSRENEPARKWRFSHFCPTQSLRSPARSRVLSRVGAKREYSSYFYGEPYLFESTNHDVTMRWFMPQMFLINVHILDFFLLLSPMVSNTFNNLDSSSMDFWLSTFMVNIFIFIYYLQKAPYKLQRERWVTCNCVSSADWALEVLPWQIISSSKSLSTEATRTSTWSSVDLSSNQFQTSPLVFVTD